MKYWENITNIFEIQRDKGISRYGQILEDNKTLDKLEVITYLQEELIDGLMYCEHLKTKNDFNDYQIKALRTAGNKNLLLNGVMGLNGEAGEVIDLVKKFLFQQHELDEKKLADELGDCLWYIAITAKSINKTLEEIADGNIEKLKKRYPDGFDANKSINREVKND